MWTNLTAMKPERLLSIDVLRGPHHRLHDRGQQSDGPSAVSSAHAHKLERLHGDRPSLPYLSAAGGGCLPCSRQQRDSHEAPAGGNCSCTASVVRHCWLCSASSSTIFPFTHLATARYYGVLPRIAICYFVVSTLYLLSPAWKDKLALIIVLLIAYWALMRFVPVPGFRYSDS